MDIQSHIRVYNEALGVKGAKGKLLQIYSDGYYEVAPEVKERFFQALLPIQGNVLLATDPLEETQSIQVDRY